MNKNIIKIIICSSICGISSYLIYKLIKNNKNNKRGNENENDKIELEKLLNIIFEINRTIEPVFLPLLEKRNEIKRNYEISDIQLNALLYEEFRKNLGEISSTV